MNGDRLINRLFRGERILWSGTPAQGLLVTDREKLLIQVIPTALNLDLCPISGSN
jgi:hypothetical protein